MNHLKTQGLAQRLGAIITAGALAASTVGAPVMAFADDNPPSAGAQTGSGSTEVTVQLPPNAGEVTGNTDSNNSDSNDADDYGDNIAFSVPTSINFVAKANGELIGPEAAATYIENHSVFDIRASSMQVSVESEWNLVEQASAAGADDKNVFDFTFGPENDQLKAVDYTTQTAVAKPTAWNMSYAVAETTGHPSDRVELVTKGHIAHVEKNISGKTKLATIKTYVRQGKAS